MKILKYISFTFIGIIAIVLIIAIFAPKQKTFSSEILIEKTNQEVYDYVKILKNQELFSFFFTSDSSITTSYTGIDGEVGSKCSWTSTAMGDGTQTITKLVPLESVESDLNFGSGESSQSKFTLASKGAQQTNVTYAATMHAAFPFNLMLMAMPMDHAFETSVKKLKELLEEPIAE